MSHDIGVLRMLVQMMTECGIQYKRQAYHTKQYSLKSYTSNGPFGSITFFNQKNLVDTMMGDVMCHSWMVSSVNDFLNESFLN